MSRKVSSSAPSASYTRAISTGSPASRRSTKLTPLTTRPASTSRHGMTRTARLTPPPRRRSSAPLAAHGPCPWTSSHPRSSCRRPPHRVGLDLHQHRRVDQGGDLHHRGGRPPRRSEEHTSELQSRQYLVCRLLLEKKKKNTQYSIRS